MWLIFAQADSTQGWVGIIVQGGAIAILGYHLLKGLPDMLDSMMEKAMKLVAGINTEHTKTVDEITMRTTKMVEALMVQFRDTLSEDRRMGIERAVLDRKEFADRNQSIIGEIKQMEQLIAKEVGPRSALIVEELHQQTQTINRQTGVLESQADMLSGLADQLSAFGSDPGKLCRAAEEMRKAGIDEKTIAKLHRVMQHRDRAAREKHSKDTELEGNSGG